MIMKKITFGIEYGFPPYVKYIEPDVELSSSDASYLKDWIKLNGACDYCYLEKDNLRLFELINDAVNTAILNECNSERAKAGEAPLDFDEMDWPSITEFYWPQELLV
jgi:hypothetical protein